MRLIRSVPLLWVLLAGSAVAQTRQIVPVPFNDSPPAEVAVSLSPKELRIGAMAAICFSASRAGYVTLWNIATNATVTRVFPNSYSQADQQDRAAMKVEPTRAACVGAGGDSFRFRVDGPAGTEDLYLLWTARPELQPRGASFDDAASFVAALRRVGESGKTEWAVAKTTYDIVPPAGATPPPLPPRQGTSEVETPRPPPSRPQQQAQQQPQQPQTQPGEASQGRVLVLSMGANVDKLTKSNQDATMFARVIAETFNVAEADGKLIPNATKADFREGMEWLRGKARPQDMVFIYFSGHGAQVQDPTRTSSDGLDELLIPYDFETKHPGSLRDGVFSQEFARWVNALGTRNVIAVLDTCHSGGLYRSIEGDVLGARSKAYKLPGDTDLTRPADLNPAPATRSAGGSGRVAANGTLMAAAKRDQSALEGPQGSFFTLALLRELRTSASGTFADTFERAAEATRSVTQGRQNPVSVGPMDTARLITFSR